MKRAVVLSTGAYLPKRCVTNRDLESMVDTTHEWIVERTGIETRHLAAEGELTSDLAAHAGKQALDAAGISPDSIDLAEDRERFRDLLERMGLEQPPSGIAYALDQAIETVKTTGADMQNKYKETARGGLAVNILTRDLGPQGVEGFGRQVGRKEGPQHHVPTIVGKRCGRLAIGLATPR